MPFYPELAVDYYNMTVTGTAEVNLINDEKYGRVIEAYGGLSGGTVTISKKESL